MKKLQKGFTLIELMIVVAIIAILAAVAAPKFGQQIKKAADAKAVQVVGSWRSGLNILYADDQEYKTTFTDILPAVDKGTSGKTTINGTASKATVTVGTNAGTISGLATTKLAEIQVVGTTTGASIEFASTNGTDTKGATWSSF